ncbi:MAG: hypothetical protein EOR86_13285 [Mesorhizobium sp.]|uniref:hypothetical protein n=1 Tax=Mesorhizobium sp. TaxID=1871066 RepID=UPI000FE7A7E8|nr:hypothetical protein [Mesorhizobium sp.]RWM96176.1 MAG: hypothetical protein EOR86_13285 [Mesorhizobium sp.]
MPTFTALEFNYGWQRAAVRPDDNRLSISSRALMQLLLWYGRTNGNEFTNHDLRHFFEGCELNSAGRYLQHVALPILQGSPLKLGSVQRYSVDRDRAMWRQLLQ